MHADQLAKAVGLVASRLTARRKGAGISGDRCLRFGAMAETCGVK
jgi:hypothetical protein